MGRKRTLPTYKKQYEALRKKGIIDKQGRNPLSRKRIQGKWTIYRLYKFYIIDKHRKTDPYFLAYSLRKRTFARIERLGPKTRVSTPSGMRTGRQFIRDIDKETERSLNKKLPGNVSPRYGRYYKSVQHVRDEFIYSLRPPIHASQLSFDSAMKRAENVTDEIVGIIDMFLKVRGALYRNHAVGSIVHYDTEHVTTASGVENPSGWIRVPWITIQNRDLIRAAMLEAFETAFMIVFKYPKGSVSVFRVDVYISTKFRGGTIDLLRARK